MDGGATSCHAFRIKGETHVLRVGDDFAPFESLVVDRTHVLGRS